MKIVLVDSSGILHSRYHGLPPRPSAIGERNHAIDVSAVHGYLSYINRLADDLSFDRLVHVLDSPEGSLARKAIYPQYKATRKIKDPVLVAQEALLPQALEAFGQRIVRQAGVEADDLIASLTAAHRLAGNEVLILSQDKDLMQLVAPRVWIMRRSDRQDVPPGRTPGKIHDFIDEAGVQEKLGVAPCQVADWLALLGDTADNIPGIAGVGPKTASAWLAKYGDLEGVVAAAPQIPGAFGARLRAGLADLPLWRRLTGLDHTIQIQESDQPPPQEAEMLTRMRAVVQAPSHWPARLFEEGEFLDCVATPESTRQPSAKPQA